MRSKRNTIIASIIVVLLLLAAIKYFTSRQTINITIDPGLSAVIYRQVDEFGNLDSSKPSATITKSGSYKLTKGRYGLVFNQTPTYAGSVQDFTLNNKPLNFTINPDYSDAKIASILTTDESKIAAIIQAAYPTAMKDHTIQGSSLYDRGTWYGAKLKYTGNDVYNSDTYRIVLHKENGNWIIATKIPKIIISSPDYPNIPKDVISKVNTGL